MGRIGFGAEQFVRKRWIASQPISILEYGDADSRYHLPRLSKVSKPIALLADRLESYSVILIFGVHALFGNLSTDVEVPVATLPVAVAGFTDVPLDLLLAFFRLLNLLVIGNDQLFFEFLIWLTPVPTLDAIFEAGNKATSAGLMSLYCFRSVRGSSFRRLAATCVQSCVLLGQPAEFIITYTF